VKLGDLVRPIYPDDSEGYVGVIIEGPIVKNGMVASKFITQVMRIGYPQSGSNLLFELWTDSTSTAAHSTYAIGADDTCRFSICTVLNVNLSANHSV